MLLRNENIFLSLQNEIIFLIRSLMEGQGTYDVMLRCCDEEVKADAAEVQRVLTRHKLSYREQGLEWIRLSHEHCDPAWMELCRQKARQMVDAREEERELLAALDVGVDFASTPEGVQRPVDTLAERHFTWVAKQPKVVVEMVSGGIMNLARGGFISDDMEQQAALRRGLGIALNAAERTSRAPWLYWLGGDSGLHYLIKSLWDMHLIYCSGGERDKWKTVCGFVLHADGSRYEPKLRACSRAGEQTRRAIDDAMLKGLRYV